MSSEIEWSSSILAFENKMALYFVLFEWWSRSISCLVGGIGTRNVIALLTTVIWDPHIGHPILSLPPSLLPSSSSACPQPWLLPRRHTAQLSSPHPPLSQPSCLAPSSAAAGAPPPPGAALAPSLAVADVAPAPPLCAELGLRPELRSLHSPVALGPPAALGRRRCSDSTPTASA